MGTALNALKKGRAKLDSEFGHTWTYRGVNFIGVAATPTEAEKIASMESGKFSPDFKFRIGVDPTQSAFTNGLPKDGDKITHSSGNFQVVSVEHAPGHHVAYISVR